MYAIQQKKELATGIVQFDVLAPLVAASAQAGQFVMVRMDEQGERIPLTIYDFDPRQGTVSIILQVVGKSTELMAELQAGDCLLDFAGPLGQPSEIEQYGRVVIIGGGVGAAPIHPIARALKAAGNEVICILGARCADLLILEEELRQASSELLIMSDDGSCGDKGLVTQGLQAVIDRGVEINRVIAIGPMPMMRAVSELTRPLGLPTIVSLNPIMVDGTGMCGACRVQVGSETKFACVDGPEFDGHLVDWKLAAQRARMFQEEERRAMESHHRKGGAGQCGCQAKKN